MTVLVWVGGWWFGGGGGGGGGRWSATACRSSDQRGVGDDLSCQTLVFERCPASSVCTTLVCGLRCFKNSAQVLVAVVLLVVTK